MPTRVTECTKKVLEQCEKYLRTFRDHGDEIPSLMGLARVIGKNRRTLTKWNIKVPEFSEFHDRLMAEQERTLINNGLNGSFNSNICKLALGKHGYHDRQEHTGADGEALIPQMSEQELARRAAFFLIKAGKEIGDAADSEG